jgi:hypothetical protein
MLWFEKYWEINMPLVIDSDAFINNGPIPSVYTCEGQDRSVPLIWANIPKKAKSLVLIVDDPDAPDPAALAMTYVHWILYNIPVTSQGLPEGVLDKQLPKGTLQGQSDWNRTSYGGPCPPVGKHRYFFKLYALDVVLPDLYQPHKLELEESMKGHILESAELIGTYQKQHKK